MFASRVDLQYLKTGIFCCIFTVRALGLCVKNISSVHVHSSLIFYGVFQFHVYGQFSGPKSRKFAIG